MPVAISFSLRASGRQRGVGGHDLPVRLRQQLREPPRLSAGVQRLIVEERDLDGRQIALEHAQLVEAAADGRLLAEARADGESQKRIEHVGRGERQDRARQPIAFDCGSPRRTVQVELQPGSAAPAVVRQRDVGPLADGQWPAVSIAIMFAGGDFASEAHSRPSRIVRR